MTELIKRINFIDASFDTSKTDAVECIAVLDSFCTSVAFKKENKIIGLKVFDHKNQNITSFSEDDFNFFDLFSSPYKSTTLLCCSLKETLVPTSVFDKSYSEDYIKFNFQSIDNEAVLNDDIKTLDITHVYTLNQSFLNTLKRIMPQAIIRNYKSALIDACFTHNGTMSNVYVNTRQDCFDCIIFTEKGLLFANTFNYKSAQDFIYYLMNVLKQLGLNPESINLFLSGAIDEGDAVYNLIYKYIRNVNLIQKPVGVEWPFADAAYHHYFALLMDK